MEEEEEELLRLAALEKERMLPIMSCQGKRNIREEVSKTFEKEKKDSELQSSLRMAKKKKHK